MTTQSYYSIQVPVWDGTTPGNPSGSTPFGYYDTDIMFQLEAPKVAEYCVRMLGFPVMEVELTSGSIYACFEDAISAYSRLVNEYNIVDNFDSVYGLNTTSSFTGKAIKPNLSRVIQVANEYATETHMAGRMRIRTGSLTMVPNQQIYDIDTLFGEVNHPGEQIEIVRIYHGGPPAIVRFFDPFAGTGMDAMNLMASFGWGGMTPAATFTMMPMYADLLRVQAIEFNDMIRRSAFSFELMGNQIRIFPLPRREYKVYFDYILTSDRVGFNNIASDGISDISNVPYNYIPYSKINDSGKQWILKYTLASAKEVLGQIRGKYSGIPIPNSEIQLNGADLLQQGQTEKDNLVQQLRETLEKMTRQSQLEKKAAESNALQETLNKIPMKIYLK